MLFDLFLFLFMFSFLFLFLFLFLFSLVAVLVFVLHFVYSRSRYSRCLPFHYCYRYYYNCATYFPSFIFWLNCSSLDGLKQLFLLFNLSLPFLSFLYRVVTCLTRLHICRILILARMIIFLCFHVCNCCPTFHYLSYSFLLLFIFTIRMRYSIFQDLMRKILWEHFYTLYSILFSSCFDLFYLILFWFFLFDFVSFIRKSERSGIEGSRGLPLHTRILRRWHLKFNELLYI